MGHVGLCAILISYKSGETQVHSFKHNSAAGLDPDHIQTINISHNLNQLCTEDDLIDGSPAKQAARRQSDSICGSCALRQVDYSVAL